MITSGAPEPASIAVENFVYSSLPWPAFVQQICTSSWDSLKRSTTASNDGYQAQTLTWVASGLTILLVQDASGSPPEHPVSAAAATAATPVRSEERRVGKECGWCVEAW